ncbi:DUF3300 domain-containing protein [Shewanella sp. WXL01]|uniref:DUF3300 domain-containing protein n=1 Tax=Shewanella sp. WXL01 TaxID=2709721 RepID=UPI0014384D24|nr:DUF3300 domain-containing protein [Shewanella sp. WXL01]NKF50009.1 DUF3300 domain-containing protein [Shewanella sp. WXL01]
MANIAQASQQDLTQGQYENLAQQSDYTQATGTSQATGSSQAKSSAQTNKLADEDSHFSDAQLAQVLAPIALYPDSLLTHILIASTYPLEIVQAHRWRKNQSDDTARVMQDVEQQSWEPSVKALAAFPTVLERLSDDLQWTQNLGDAFLQDEGRVLDAIQTLRHQADQANSLDDMENVTVTKTDKQIIIEPVQKEIVYVPYYDTRVVYGNWYWAHYPPVYWHPPVYWRPPVYVSHRPIYWGPGIHISFNYYFSAFRWSYRRVVVINHRHSHIYRPARKIAYSSGAQRWRHKPQHRKGVAYRSVSVSKRYQGSYAKPHVRAKPTVAINHHKAQVTKVHRGLDRANLDRTSLDRKSVAKVTNKPANYKASTKQLSTQYRDKQYKPSSNSKQTHAQQLSRNKSSHEQKARNLTQKLQQQRSTASRQSYDKSAKQTASQSLHHSNNNSSYSQRSAKSNSQAKSYNQRANSPSTQKQATSSYRGSDMNKSQARSSSSYSANSKSYSSRSSANHSSQSRSQPSRSSPSRSNPSPSNKGNKSRANRNQ